MTQTSSPTLLQDSSSFMGQAALAELLGKTSAVSEDPRHQQPYYFVSQLIDSTSDGGTRLASIVPQYKLSTYEHPENISTLFYILIISALANLITKATSYTFKHLTSPSSIVSLSHGKILPHVDAIQWIKTNTGFSWDRIGRLIGVTRQTIHNWENGEPISDSNQRRLFAVREVLERAMSKHPTRNRLAAWLDTPRGADGRSPAELLEANEINRARLLAIASPSPGLIRAQHWVKQPIPEAFRKGAEHYPEALPPEQVDDLEVSFDDTDHMEDLPTS